MYLLEQRAEGAKHVTQRVGGKGGGPAAPPDRGDPINASGQTSARTVVSSPHGRQFQAHAGIVGQLYLGELRHMTMMPINSHV